MRSSARHVLAALAAACGLAVVCASPAIAATPDVCTDGSCPFATLQAAVNAVKAPNSDLPAGAGPYPESVNLTVAQLDGLPLLGPQAGNPADQPAIDTTPGARP